MTVNSKAIYDKFVKDQLTCDFKDLITAGTAVPIHEKDGSVGFWRIPLEVAGRVAGMIDVSTTGAVQRYGLQVTKQADIPHKPEDILELSPSKILVLAVSVVGPQAASVRKPRLMSLGAPTRVAWEATMKEPENETPVTVYVTPGYAWIAPDDSSQPE